jgi:predicted glycosyltransferase involved in capsule biosynthesis
MGRRKFLEQALPSWLPVKQFNKIIIVDWGARENLPELVGLDKRIVVLQVPGEKYFDVGSTRNVPTRYSKADYIFHIDADVKLVPNPEFIDLLKGVVEGEYYNIVPLFHNKYGYSGPIGGTMLVDKRFHDKINGFVENLPGWGSDDDNFINRIRRRFGNDLHLKHEWFNHIKHGSKARTENFKSGLNRTECHDRGNEMLKTINVQTQPRKKYLCIEYTRSGKKEMTI